MDKQKNARKSTRFIGSVTLGRGNLLLFVPMLLAVAIAVLLPLYARFRAPPADPTSSPAASDPQVKLSDEIVAGVPEETICPAIEQDEGRRTNYPGESERPVSLVVLGPTKVIKAPSEGDGVFEVTVEKVLYGSTSAKKVRYAWLWDHTEGGGTQITALAEAPYEGEAEFDQRYIMPASDEAAQRALGEARLDYHALRAKCIFMGKETAAGTGEEEDLHDVKVVQPIFGEVPAIGTTVVVRDTPYAQEAEAEPVTHPESAIYLVREITPGVPDEADGKPIYVLECRMAAELQGVVREALGRRETYPIVEAEVEGELKQVREVMFRGSTEEAIAVMGSSSPAAVTLASRKLLRDKEAVKEAVLAAIRRDLLRQEVPAGGDFHRLNSLIALLGKMGEGKVDGAVAVLLDEALAGMAGHEHPTVTRAVEDAYFQPEQAKDDVNHALAWLVMALDEAMVDSVGDRLIKARDAAQGGWKEELELALEAGQVVDRRELKAATARMAGREPVRAEAGFQIKGSPIAFSDDGKLMAAGTHVWNTADWTAAGGFDLRDSIAATAFSLDGRILYVAGGARKPFIYGYDWKTGKVIKEFPEAKGSARWAGFSQDMTVMAIASSYERKAWLFDLETGKAVVTKEMPEDCYEAALSADGKTFVWQSGKYELTALSLDGGTTQKIPLAEHMVGELAFSRDGKYLISSNYDFKRMEIVAHEVAAGYRVLARAEISGERCTSLAVSPDGARVVAANHDGKVWSLSLPGLEERKGLLTDERDSWGNRGASVAFTADGTLMVVGDSYRPVRVFRGGSLEPIATAGAGHSGHVVAAYFSADGTRLRTRGIDETMCLRDAKTLKVLHRAELPTGYTYISTRGDGKYVLCYQSAKVKGPTTQAAESCSAKVVDADTGEVVSSLTLPRASIHWVDEKEAVAATTTHLCRFDYMNGKVIKDVQLKDRDGWTGDLSGDGKSLVVINEGRKRWQMAVSTLNLDTGELKVVGTTDLPAFTGNQRGVIPGGKYGYIAIPGMYIFDCQTAKLVATKRYGGSYFLSLAFSGDGGRYAFAFLALAFSGDGGRYAFASGDKTLIRVQETLSGKTVAVFSAPTRTVRALAVSQDGQRVAVAGENGELEIWDVGP